MHRSNIHDRVVIAVLQELVEDVAVATSSRHADLSWARRFDDTLYDDTQKVNLLIAVL